MSGVQKNKDPPDASCLLRCFTTGCTSPCNNRAYLDQTQTSVSSLTIHGSCEFSEQALFIWALRANHDYYELSEQALLMWALRANHDSCEFHEQALLMWDLRASIGSCELTEEALDGSCELHKRAIAQVSSPSKPCSSEVSEPAFRVSSLSKPWLMRTPSPRYHSRQLSEQVLHPKQSHESRLPQKSWSLFSMSV